MKKQFTEMEYNEMGQAAWMTVVCFIVQCLLEISIPFDVVFTPVISIVWHIFG